MIGGNHEPFNRLRDWDAAHYDYRLNYTDSGDLVHDVPGMRVYGLTGICGDNYGKRGRSEQWPYLVEQVKSGEKSAKELMYYRKREVDQLLGLRKRPHILMTHNWPIRSSPTDSDRLDPERELLNLLEPQFHFSGHKHLHHIQQIGNTRFEGLNLIYLKNQPTKIAEGWCRLLEWDGAQLRVLED